MKRNLVFSVLIITLISTQVLAQSPGNDDPATPTILAIGTPSNATTVGATATAGVTPPSPYTNNDDDDDVWFAFQATSITHTISFENISNKYSTMVAILYSWDPAIGGIPISIQGQVGTSKIDFKSLAIGTTYYIQTFTLGPNVSTNFNLILTFTNSIAETISTLSSFATTNQDLVSVAVDNGNYKVVYFDAAGQLTRTTFPVEKNKIYTNKTTPKNPFNISILTIPIKIRPSLDTNRQNVNTGIKNIGVMIGRYKKWDRYFANGKLSTHKISGGLIIAPSGEEYKSANTKGKVYNSTQFVLSTGIIFTYSYNNISFGLIPLGIDFPMTADGRNWIYNKKRWWGIGIGVDTKLFGF